MLSKDVYTLFARHEYNRIIARSAGLKARFPTIRDAYIGKLLGRECPYLNPKIRITGPDGKLRMFEVHADDPQNWRQRLFSEVGSRFNLPHVRIHTEDNEMVITGDTAIDDLVGLDRVYFQVDDSEEGESVVYVPPPQPKTIEKQNTQVVFTPAPAPLPRPIKAEPIPDDFFSDINETYRATYPSLDNTTYNNCVIIFLKTTLEELVSNEQAIDVMRSAAEATRITWSAFKDAAFTYEGKDHTMQTVVEEHGKLNYGYFINRARLVLQEAVMKVSGELNNVDTSKFGVDKLGEYRSRVVDHVVEGIAPALQLFEEEVDVSVSDQHPIVADGVTSEGLRYENDKIDNNDAQFILGRRTKKLVSATKTIFSSTKNQFSKSKYVSFTVVGGGKTKLSSVRADVEPGQQIQMHIKSLKKKKDPEWILIRVAEVASTDKSDLANDTRFCASWKLRRWPTSYMLPFTIPIHRGKYRVYVYVPHDGGLPDTWTYEGGAEFLCSVIGKRLGIKISWDEFNKVSQLDEHTRYQLYLTEEVENGRIAGVWPFPNENGGATTFSSVRDSDGEIAHWHSQESEQQLEMQGLDLVRSFANAANAKTHRIRRTLYCIRQYLNTGKTEIDVSRIQTADIEFAAHPEDYSGEAPIAATITMFGTNYDTSTFPSSFFSSRPVETDDDIVGPDAHPPETKDSSFINGINVDKLHNFVSEMNEEPSVDNDKFDTFANDFPSQSLPTEKKDTDTSVLINDIHIDEDESLSDEEDDERTKALKEFFNKTKATPPPSPTRSDIDPFVLGDTDTSTSTEPVNLHADLFSSSSASSSAPIEAFTLRDVVTAFQLPDTIVTFSELFKQLCVISKVCVDHTKCIILGNRKDSLGHVWREVVTEADSTDPIDSGYYEILFLMKIVMSTVPGYHKNGYDIYVSNLGYLYNAVSRTYIDLSNGAIINTIFRSVTNQPDANIQNCQLDWLNLDINNVLGVTPSSAFPNNNRLTVKLSEWGRVALKMYTPGERYAVPRENSFGDSYAIERKFADTAVVYRNILEDTRISSTRNKRFKGRLEEINEWCDRQERISDRLGDTGSEDEDDGMENRLSAAGHHLLAAFQSIPQDPSLHEATDHILDSLAIVPQTITFSINKIGEIFRNLVEDTTDVAGNDGIFITIVPSDAYPLDDSGDLWDFMRERTERNEFSPSALREDVPFNAKIGDRELKVVFTKMDTYNEDNRVKILDAESGETIDENAIARVHFSGIFPRRIVISVYTDAFET
jgi:hypothetical protein